MTVVDTEWRTRLLRKLTGPQWYEEGIIVDRLCGEALAEGIADPEDEDGEQRPDDEILAEAREWYRRAVLEAEHCGEIERKTDIPPAIVNKFGENRRPMIRITDKGRAALLATR